MIISALKEDLKQRVAGESVLIYQTTSASDIRCFFESRSQHVVTFAGFGELGYEEEGIVARVVRDIAGEWRPQDLIVNSGTLLRVGGQDGIARVYPVAKSLGIMTSGIHPGVALDFAETHRVSPHEDHVFFVEDASWGGFLDDRGTLSPTLRIVLEVSDELVVVGGGKHAAHELAAFLKCGKRVRYFAADMNRLATQEWCDSVGVEIRDFRGEAHGVWLARKGQQRSP